jgi:hypothetical protein
LLAVTFFFFCILRKKIKKKKKKKKKKTHDSSLLRGPRPLPDTAHDRLKYLTVEERG